MTLPISAKVTVKKAGNFVFSDVADWRVDKLSYHFVYQCHAAVWAIAQYDAARKAVAADA
ncbi:hypothetical protein AB0E04_17690 [Streptomyces sp. NPDC048251]|uniref:hypothetical protein n=1 Tax=Streptomyces sp. NPDC048251 TaxID=3154501 RepID=UPI0034382229